VLCVRWYLRYCLTLRDLEEMRAERRLRVDHCTIGSCVLPYAPELHNRFAAIPGTPIAPGGSTKPSESFPLKGTLRQVNLGGAHFKRR
jgi:hypothetical protein